MTSTQLKRQPADKRIRLTEMWRCDDGHEFGYDRDRCGDAPRHCPHIVGRGDNGRWLGCAASVARVRAAGVLR